MSSTERSETESIVTAALPSMAEFQVFIYSLLQREPPSCSDSAVQAQELEMTELRSELLCSKKVCTNRAAESSVDEDCETN